MLVTEIEILDYVYCDRSDRFTANVSVTAQDRIVSLLCHVGSAEDRFAPSPDALIGEAKRQLARMPEFRSGRTVLQFADDMRPTAPAELA